MCVCVCVCVCVCHEADTQLPLIVLSTLQVSDTIVDEEDDEAKVDREITELTEQS